MDMNSSTFSLFSKEFSTGKRGIFAKSGIWRFIASRLRSFNSKDNDDSAVDGLMKHYREEANLISARTGFFMI